MKKIMSALGILLTLALIFTAMPIAAQAQGIEIAMQAHGGILSRSAITPPAQGSIRLATVTEDASHGAAVGVPWADTIDPNINFFQLGNRQLRPGSSGAYHFTLRNTCVNSQPIDWWFSLSVGTTSPYELPIRYSLRINNAATTIPINNPGALGNVPDQPFPNVMHASGAGLPHGSTVPFTLYWEWPMYDAVLGDMDAQNTPIGIASREANRSTYTVELRFVVECDPLDETTTTRPGTTTPPGTTQPGETETTTQAPETTQPGETETTTAPPEVDGDDGAWWLWPIIGGMIVGGAIIGGGIAMSTLPGWALVALLPVLTYIGWSHCCARRCPRDKCVAEDPCDTDDANIADDCDEPGEPPGFVRPPQTGDSYVWPVILVVLALAAGIGLVFLLKSKRRDNEA